MKHLDTLNIYKVNIYQMLNPLLNTQYQKPFKIKNTITLQDTEDTISKNQIIFEGYKIYNIATWTTSLNKHSDKLLSLWHFSKPKSKIAS